MKQRTEEIAANLSSYHTVTYDELPDIELYLDQVVGYVQRQMALFQRSQTENLVTPAILSNSVKSGLIPRPNKKKYVKRHLAASVMACTLKQVFPVQQVEQLLNLFEGEDEKKFEAFGRLQDESLACVAKSISYTGEDAQQMFDQIMRLALRANANRLAARMLLKQLEHVPKG